MRRDAVEAGDGGDDGAGAHRALGAQRRAVQRGRHQHEPPGRELPRQHGAQQQERADLVPAHERSRAARVADEAGEHLRQPLGRVRVPRPVLGVAVERQVGQHEPEAVAELLHQRLPLAVREAGRVEQRERRPGARLAVGDPRPVGMVVEAELHGAQPIVESGAVLRRSRYDREIVGLAIPALGALAAEPLYVLVDTAIVGHLGTPQLASLAIAATVLSTAFTVFNFLTYGTTAQVARLHGAGEDDEAAHVGAQAQWLSLIVGALLLLAVAALAHPLVVLMGGEGEVADGATTYLRDRGARRTGVHARERGPGLPARDRRPDDAARDPRRRARGQRRARAAVRLRLRLGARRLGVGDGDRAARDGSGVPGRAAARRLAAAGRGADARADADRVGDRGAHDGAARRVPRRVGRARASRARDPR